MEEFQGLDFNIGFHTNYYLHNILIMEKAEQEQFDGKSIYKIIGWFFISFSVLIYMAVFFTEGFTAKITNGIIGTILAGIGWIFLRYSKS